MKNYTNHQTNTTSSSANIISVLQNITSGIRRKITKITDKDSSAILSCKNITMASIIIILSIAYITLFTSGNFGNTGDVSALSYSTSEDISFTFAPTLSIGLSTDSLTIDNLVPGTTSDSNTVTVTVSSNTPYGYVLSAGVGSNDTTSPYYNTSSLTHENTTISNVFSSVDTNASLNSLDTDNTWGYSTSTDGGTSWSTYSGLSHTTTKPLLDISDPATPSTIDFKIAARSATTQASGTYNNVITFYAVGKPEPVPTYLQDAATIKAELQNVGDEMQAVDIRDNKEYWIRKMADGNIWMTQNLDLELDSNKTYTPADTDVSTSWQPVRSTIEFTGTSVVGWGYDNNSPYSASPGELYVYTSGTTNDDDQYTSLAACQAVHPDCSARNHVGNYYNWSAAAASNNTSGIVTKYSNAPYSICPAGWRLPKITGSGKNVTGSEFGSILVAENIITNPIFNNQTYVTGGFDRIRITPLWLSRSGKIGFGSLNDLGNRGRYWSSTVTGISNSYDLFFTNYSVYPFEAAYRYDGLSIRCLVK